MIASLVYIMQAHYH